ncbi:glycosidase [Roseiarcus fermentans]|uniref:Glycosidase n=1 Tax=Roseiarcus fermentans TaxID=1473586 RepID=A0A366FDW6_9HYPH|nr:alpha-amylase family protein [Roseiarcus fermentans]RBP12276.1 glycosidase [Roseiarcus fermentans]
MTSWVEHAIVWQVYPLGFVGADIRPERPAPLAHRLPRLIDWLDYAVELGASALLLGPIFASASHGYDTIDHFRIDPRLGDEADFDALIRAAGSRGLKVALDGVFNHVSRRHPAFQEALARGPSAPGAALFRLSWASGEPEAATFEGHSELVVLDHDRPEVEDLVAAVMIHWLDRGIGGWRLDAAYAVPARFWARVLPRVRARHPDAYLFAEVIHGDYAGFVTASGVDSVTQYELWKAIWSALNDRNVHELAWALDRHNGLLDAFVPQTFVGNHDVTRLASRLSDPRGIECALAILMTCGGTPSIYAGDEQAFRGVKEDRLGGDDAVRPAFPDRPEALSALGLPVFRRHQELIGLRRRHPWLHRAKTRVVHLAYQRFVYEAFEGENRLMIALNLGEGTDLPAPGMRSVLAGRDARLKTGAGEARVALGEGAWAILSPAEPL